MLRSQTFFLDPIKARSAPSLSENAPGDYLLPLCSDDCARQPDVEGHCYMGDSFYLGTTDARVPNARIQYFRQEDFIKFHLRLSGKSVTVMDGFGQYEFDGPELLILSAPKEMAKADLYQKNVRRTFVSMCVRRDFFSQHMDIDPEQLPEPIRSMAMPDETRFALHGSPLTPTLAAAARSLILDASPPALAGTYYPAKAVELMCLLIGHFTPRQHRGTAHRDKHARQETGRLNQVREWLTARYSEPFTLDEISRQAGLSRTALTSGFRRLFGISVFDFVHQQRMQAAWQMLLDGGQSVTQIAQAVGYGHSGNFSVAFRNYFGCLPKAVREKSPAA